MELTWGEDYEALAGVSKSAFARYSPLEDPASLVPIEEQVKQFAELGWLQLSSPQQGLAHPEVDDEVPLSTIAAIFVEMGAALVGAPLLDLITARDAALVADTGASVALAQRMGVGSAMVMPVLDGVGPLSSDWGSNLVFDRGVLTGSAFAVPYADHAEGYLVFSARDNPALLFVDSQPLISCWQMPNMGGHPLFALRFDDVAVPQDNVFAIGTEAERAATVAIQRGSVLRAAEVYGAARSLLAMTVRYAQERHQFGGPIGRFQAVQYLCTDIAIAAHLTSAHVRSAAAAIDAGRGPEPHLGLMRKQAAKTAAEMVHSAHEVHAGIGYMIDSKVHLFTNAAKRWQFDFGAEADNNDAIVAALDQMQSEGSL